MCRERFRSPAKAMCRCVAPATSPSRGRISAPTKRSRAGLRLAARNANRRRGQLSLDAPELALASTSNPQRRRVVAAVKFSPLTSSPSGGSATTVDVPDADNACPGRTIRGASATPERHAAETSKRSMASRRPSTSICWRSRAAGVGSVAHRSRDGLRHPGCTSTTTIRPAQCGGFSATPATSQSAAWSPST